MLRPDYLPIEDYGLVGNMRTAALVGKNGSVDWLCLPHFDSPSVFGALLDAEKGGRFEVAPAGNGYRTRQVYWPDTNVLVTRFAGPDGAAEVIDYMPVGADLREGGYHRLIRRVEVLRGAVEVRMRCAPAFSYARQRHTVELVDGAAVFEAEDGMALALTSTFPLVQEGEAVAARCPMRAGDTATFVVRLLAPDERAPEPLTAEEEERLRRNTIAFWRSWLEKCTYTGRWREAVRRSALVLKLLTFEPTGAIVAAPTTSLPEYIGGARNWDYRYAWIRDAAFTLYGLLRIGFTEEVRAFIGWLQSRCEAAPDPSGPAGPLQIVYGIDGRRDLTERTLDHLDGYRGSRPVRIGNGAAGQIQLDIYGELLDAIYLYDKYGTPVTYDFWRELVRYLDWVCAHWEVEDEGIWEVRGPKQQFVYSKLMSWVALDRGLRLAQKRSLPAPRARWLDVRDRIFERILKEGWSEERQAFVQAFGGTALDASNLLMPLVFFLGPNDPRVLATLDATLKTPEEGGLTYDCLVWRYNLSEVDDGVEGEREGAFNLCTFWLVEALARAGRTEPERLERAYVLFEKMLGYSNHLGLFAEQTGLSGQARGNFPQAFSHLGLISAAFNLDRALGGHGPIPGPGRPGAAVTLPPLTAQAAERVR
ncbi:MAG TPA: glycoside hydrolase family 15 protein [Rubricoccaceae bacterium]|nr:glycoside hydrolase family 15 protein [Rubricoccaceae bacterium]